MIVRPTLLFHQTPTSEVEAAFLEYTQERKDIAILLINQHIAEKIRPIVDKYTQAFPALLEIPAKDHPYGTSETAWLQLRPYPEMSNNRLTKKLAILSALGLARSIEGLGAQASAEAVRRIELRRLVCQTPLINQLTYRRDHRHRLLYFVPGIHVALASAPSISKHLD